MSLRPEEISAIIRQEIEGYENAVSMDEVGTILEVGDGIARIYGPVSYTHLTLPTT